jgi:hypothetical protein
MRKPYDSKARGCWVIGTIDASGRRSRVRLGDTKREAFDAWQRMLEGQWDEADARLAARDPSQSAPRFPTRNPAGPITPRNLRSIERGLG